MIDPFRFDCSPKSDRATRSTVVAANSPRRSTESHGLSRIHRWEYREKRKKENRVTSSKINDRGRQDLMLMKPTVGDNTIDNTSFIALSVALAIPSTRIHTNKNHRWSSMIVDDRYVSNAQSIRWFVQDWPLRTSLLLSLYEPILCSDALRQMSLSHLFYWSAFPSSFLLSAMRLIHKSYHNVTLITRHSASYRE